MGRKYLLILVILLIIVIFASVLITRRLQPPPRQVVSSSLPVELLWQAELDEVVAQHPIIIDDTVIVTSGRTIYGLDKGTGETRWKHAVNRLIRSIVISGADSIVVYGDQDGQITALEVVSGDIIWQRKLGDRQDNYYWITSLVIRDGVVYVASQPTAIERINLETGEPTWFVHGSDYGIPGRAARVYIWDDSLYVFTTETHLLDPQTGMVKEQFDVNITPPQLEGDRFYGPTWIRDTRRLQVVAELRSPSTRILSDGCTQFDLPYTFSQNDFYAVGRCGGVFALERAKNQIRWSYHLESLGNSPTSEFHGSLYVVFDDGEIHAIELETGHNQGILQSNKRLPGVLTTAKGIVSDDEVMIATFNDEHVWAFCEKPCF